MIKQSQGGQDFIQATIIHIRPFKETSVIIDCFCQYEGKVSAIVKGAKRPRSQIKAYVQLFYPLNIRFGGRGELKTVYAIEPFSPIFSLKGANLLVGLYLNELLMHFLTQDEYYVDLYHEYMRALAMLAGTDTVPEVALRYFELSLMQSLGYGLELGLDVDKNPIVPEKNYLYHPESGLKPTYLLESSQYVVVEGASVLSLLNKQLETKTALMDAKRLMRFVINQQLGSKTLMSRELMRQYKRAEISESQ